MNFSSDSAITTSTIICGRKKYVNTLVQFCYTFWQPTNDSKVQSIIHFGKEKMASKFYQSTSTIEKRIACECPFIRSKVNSPPNTLRLKTQLHTDLFWKQLHCELTRMDTKLWHFNLNVTTATLQCQKAAFKHLRGNYSLDITFMRKHH